MGDKGTYSYLEPNKRWGDRALSILCAFYPLSNTNCFKFRISSGMYFAVSRIGTSSLAGQALSRWDFSRQLELASRRNKIGTFSKSMRAPECRGISWRKKLRTGWSQRTSQEDSVLRTHSLEDSRAIPQTSFDGAVDSPEDLWIWRKKLLWRLVAFVIPALSITLADPLMSLVDTLCIGRYGTTIELAALGPNTVVFNFTSYIFFSIGL